MKLDKQRIRVIISIMFSFLMTLLFVVLYLCAGFILGFFNGDSVTRAIKESSYYNNVYTEVYSAAKTIVTEAGFPDTVLDNAVSLERVYISNKNYVEKALRGEATEANTDKLREALTNNINTYLLEKNIEQTQALDASIAEMITRIDTKYKEAIQLQLANNLAAYKVRYEKMISIMIPIILAIIGVLSFFLIKMYKYKHKGIRYIVYAIMTSSLMTMIVAFLLIKTKQYARTEVIPDYYKSMITAYLRWDMTVFIYIGGIGFTIAIALAYVVYYMKSRMTFH